MKMKKKTLAITLFSVAFLAIVIVSALVLWQKDVLPPVGKQPDDVEEPTGVAEEDPLLYPVLADNGLWGYMSHKGEIKIPAVYKQADFFLDNIAWVQGDNGLWGAIDQTGQAVLEPVYESRAYVDDGSSGLVVATNSGNSNLYDGNGTKRFGVEGRIGLLSNGWLAFSRYKGEQELWGYMDSQGKIVIEPVYQAAGPAGEYNVIVQAFDGGKQLLSRSSGSAVSLDNGIALDAAGSNRVLFTAADGKFGYLGPDGAIAIQPAYAAAQPFRGGAALVRSQQGYGLLGADGQWLVRPTYETGAYLGNGYYRLGKKDQEAFTIFDGTGKQAVSLPVYQTGQWQNGILPLQTEKATRFLKSGIGMLGQPSAALQYNLGYTGHLFYVFDENGMAYYELDGTQVYTMGRELALDSGMQLKNRLANHDVSFQVYYPQVVMTSGGTVSKGFAALNQRLEEVALGDYETNYKNPDGSVNYMVRGSYQHSRSGNVVSVLQKISIDDYWVHNRDGSLPEWEYETVCFDTASGRQYSLSSLFAKGVNWRNDLLVPMQDMYTVYCAGKGIEEDPEVSRFLSERLDRNVPYLLDRQGLTLYAKLADGNYQEIRVLYQDFEGIINKTGDLWLSLQQEAAPASTKLDSNVGEAPAPTPEDGME